MEHGKCTAASSLRKLSLILAFLYPNRHETSVLASEKISPIGFTVSFTGGHHFLVADRRWGFMNIPRFRYICLCCILGAPVGQHHGLSGL